MNDSFDSLQDRLTRLEAGEPLEAVCADLPEAEVGLVQMAAALRAVPAPERSLNTVAAQRMELLRAAKSFKALNTLPKTDEVRRMAQPARTRNWWPLALAGGLAAMFACALVVAALAGAFWLWQSSTQPSVARNTAPAPDVAVQTSPAPNIAAVEAPDPQHAVLAEARGLVEIQSSDGAWAAAETGQTIAAGQRVRTGALSAVTLAFYDGSRARLGPNAEVSVDALDAQPPTGSGAGPRVILLTQWVGESDHDVAHSDDPASRYEVATPSGVGAAKGTSFSVLVTVLFVRFDVDEGTVAVTNLNITVIVIAGQTTLIPPGEPPQEPLFHIRGEGEVSEISGNAWRIGGQTFLTDASTVIVGDPQVGDWVSVEGRLLSDGTRFADRITLLHRSTLNKFEFTGMVEVISDTQWTIAGRVVRVDEFTTIEAGIAVGDQVEVRGGIAQDGTWWASSIALAAESGFEFTGVVESIGETSWTISGISVTVNVSTTIDAGIVVSDVVHVEGEILNDGTWLATSIEKAAETTFDFVGVVISMEPWIVSGVPISVTNQTHIDEEIDIGNRVRVKGSVLADGTWLAESIEQIDEGKRHHVEFTAKVESIGIDAWMVGGVLISVTEQTKIDSGIEVGDLVRVKGNLLPDGTVNAKQIRLVRAAQGCVETSVVVQAVSADQITLLDGQVIPLDPQIVVQGELQVASVVIVKVCVADDGTPVVVSIVVIFQLDSLPPTAVPPTPTAPPSSDDTGVQVTICHRPPGNPNAAHTITVPQSALQSHLNHGDTLGPCANNGGGDQDDDDDDDDDDD